ncbi:MAG: 16S rRNA (guanine(966)-N(2))-methyltransferase RsmD [Bacteroidales bacterium]|nr:16S rRNA (guanine(966)-N(2))-methyltransferase RsmD [Bacteroidales bacterium]
MRIVSGILRGRQINPPSSFNSRPTTDYAKESLFNILNSRYDFSDCDVLDLFAGTGSISFEFCSRESKSVTAVELNAKMHNFIKTTAQNFKCQNFFSVKADALRYLKSTSHKYDIIFADPPYQSDKYEEIHELCFSRELLKPDGVLILEHDKSLDLSKLKNFEEYRKYAGVFLSFFYNIKHS